MVSEGFTPCFSLTLVSLSFNLLDCHLLKKVCDRSFSAFTRNLPKSPQPVDRVAFKDVGYAFQQPWMYLLGSQFYRG